jgi:ABC-2 type transport system permease protein
MINLIQIELYKIFRKPRTYIGFGAIAFIVIVVNLGFLFEGEQLLGFLIDSLKDKFLLSGNLINAYTMAFVILNSLWIHLPILISITAGDMISGEANNGTFRLLLTRPVSRSKLLAAKFISAWIYTVLVLIFMILLSLSLGYLIFGIGDLIVIKTTISILSSDDTLWRFGYATLYGILSMTTVTSMSFLLSSLSENSIGPIVGTFAIIVGLTIVSTLGYALIAPIVPYLFTTYLPSWDIFFQMEMDIEKLYRAIAVNLVYTFAFITYTFYYFKNKDILS